MDRIKFANQVRQWLGVPYRHRGATRNGCDCTGLLIGAARELGFLINYEIRKYPQDWNLHNGADDHIVKQLEQFGSQIPNAQADAGDIIIMHFGRCLAHCGVLMDKEKMLMVHCYRTTKKCKYGILRNSKWSRCWKRTYRLDEKKMAQFS